MENKIAVEVLNDLIKINDDRIATYEKAVEKLTNVEAALKSLFYKIADECRDMKKQLSDKVTELGGVLATESSLPGNLYHHWRTAKVDRPGEDAVSALAACEGGDEATIEAYRAAETQAGVRTDIRDMLEKQHHLLKMSCELIRNQRAQKSEERK